jgi:alpha-1,2-mannosyltransferase
VLVGVAAAIKLTPLIFVPHLLLTGRRADAGRALGTFAGLNALGAVALPGDTVQFWAVALIDGNDATANSWIGNQSLNGIVQRLAGHGSRTLVAVGVLSAACLVASALVVRRLHRRDQRLGALLVTAFCGLLVCPVSWTHHWVWVVALVASCCRGRSEAAAGPGWR